MPIGIALAGGRGRRMGGEKATVELEGRALLTYPVAALRSVLTDVVVVAKADTLMPELTGVSAIWLERDETPHPLTGIAHALAVSAGRSVLVCAGDLPLMTAAVLQALLDARLRSDAAVVPRVAGRLQPLCAIYSPAALPALASRSPSASTTDVVLTLDPRVIELDDEDAFYNVNAPEDLLRAAALLDARRQTRSSR